MDITFLSLNSKLDCPKPKSVHTWVYVLAGQLGMHFFPIALIVWMHRMGNSDVGKKTLLAINSVDNI